MSNDGIDIENLPPPDDDDDWDDDSWLTPPLTETPDQRQDRRDREAARRKQLESDLVGLRSTIEDRERHGASGEDLRGELARLRALEDALDFIDPVDEWVEDEEPTLVQPVPPRTFNPVSTYRREVRELLSDEEHEHFEALRQGETQESLAKRLGIGQAAVSRREDRLRAKINPIHRRLFGTDDVLLDRGRIQGRQGRRRQRQE